MPHVRPRRGDHQVAGRRVVALGAAREVQPALVDGRVGLVMAVRGRLSLVLAFALGDDDRITAIDVIADPERLRALRIDVLAARPDETAARRVVRPLDHGSERGPWRE
ncbi:hypothetical protein N566_09875 [Streptomycetaceae bacterium MP113-05]|nr:hypothetical protein N566_09875 [Streptomycetaceae bacterium MP113-05]